MPVRHCRISGFAANTMSPSPEDLKELSAASVREEAAGLWLLQESADKLTMPLSRGAIMPFTSILFEKPEDRPLHDQADAETRDCITDLNLDQIIGAITANREEYHLEPYFYTHLTDVRTIAYRQEVMQDLEAQNLSATIGLFSHKMRTMRQYLDQEHKGCYKHQTERWFLDAVETYCAAVADLVKKLAFADLKSRGLIEFRDYLTAYRSNAEFLSLWEETAQLKADLAGIQYSLLIKGHRIQVQHYDGEEDYSTVVQDTFSKFKVGPTKDYRVPLPSAGDMNHVEAAILDLVAQLFSEVFTRLDHFCATHRSYLDGRLGLFDREIQFYLAYIEYMAAFKKAGLAFCYPSFSNPGKAVHSYESFDLALANKLLAQRASVVCNDFSLERPERIVVVSGPNQGGKTTFARAFGQLHYLASIGCPVPGREARVFAFDKLFTHFEREENRGDFRGKLQDDLVRIHEILSQATSSSIIIMNEIFTSTTLQDAIFISEQVMTEILQRDMLGVCVTFIEELSSLSDAIVSMVSTVVPNNPALRTYKIVRKSASGQSYALSIAEKHRLTYAWLKERIPS